MRLYHFTNRKYGLEDLREKHLKVARIRDLNDPTEFLAADMSNVEFRNAAESMKESFSNDHGILCFSKNWRSLVQWAHYSDKHKGICLGFDIPDHFLCKVEYVNFRLRPDEMLDRSGKLAEYMIRKMEHYIENGGSPVTPDKYQIRKKEFLDKQAPKLLSERTETDQEGQEFAKKMLTTKGKEWAYEKEYRIFVPLNSCELVRSESGGHIENLHFVKFPSEDLMLREVIIGPRSDVTCKQIEDALGKMANCVNIRKAAISPCEYAVVESIDIPPDKIGAFCRR